MPEELLDGLNPAQHEAVTSPAMPLCILAGAGTGKTRVLTRRIAYRCATGDAEAGRVLALTFTRKAAAELRTRLGHLGIKGQVEAGTFHSVAYLQLRRRWDERRIEAPGLLDRKIGLVSRALPRDAASGGRGSAGRAVLLEATGEIEWAKARMVSPDRYADAAATAGRRTTLPAAAIAATYRRYEDEKRRRRMVDFDDLLLLCARAIEEDESFAASQRWRYRHLFVDEFQDVNALQHRLLRAWLGDRQDLCVVGDPNQAIYAWNGADARYLSQFERHHPGGATVALDTNYRSSGSILAIANTLLDAGGLAGVRLRTTRDGGPLPLVRSFADEQAEARGIARAVLDRHGPSSRWKQQAVLVRTNAQTVAIAEAFRHVHIPVRVRGAVPFLELPEVKEAMRDLRRSRRPLVEGLAALDAELHDGDANQAEPGESALGEAELDRRRNLDELLRLASEYSALERRPDADGLAQWLTATLGHDDAGREADAVEVLTMHAAKGLEWPVVHVAGVEDGLVPIGHARTQEALDEERRLLFVAITRAERELLISLAENRTFGTRTASRRPSPFLVEIGSVLDAMRAGTAPAAASGRVAAMRRTLEAQRGRRGPRGQAGGRRTGPAADPEKRPSDPNDVALFEELRRWRSTRARATNKPAFVVFDDRTLTAIAIRRPSTEKDLLDIPGIGPVKVQTFGPDLLELIARHGGTEISRS